VVRQVGGGDAADRRRAGARRSADGPPRGVRGLTHALHASRTASRAGELRAIENILRAGADEAVTVKEIGAKTGMSVQTVRWRLGLRSLTPVMRARFDEGKITTTVAEAAARLPEAEQMALQPRLEASSRLSVVNVRAVARERTDAVTSELPAGLFEEHETASQVTVREHLTAASAPSQWTGARLSLQRAIGNALAVVERV
jgi:hypothetical protein